MSRIMRSVGPVISATPGLVEMLLCPAGHKYEVIAAGLQTATGTAPNYQGFLHNRGATYTWVRYQDKATDFVVPMDPLGPVLLEEGDKLFAYFTYTGMFALVTYVDVSPV